MNPKNDEYTICFKNIIFLLKIFATFPFYPLHEVFNMSGTVSTILTFVALSMYSWIVLHEQKNSQVHFVRLIEDFNYVRLMGFIPYTIAKLSLLITPCVMWNKTKQLQNLRNGWIRFQVEFEKLSKTPFKCPIKNKIQRTIATPMICMNLIAILLRTREWNEPEATSNILAVLFLTNGTAIVIIYWIINNMFIISSSKEIFNLVRQTLKNGRDTDLRRLIVLWIMLCDLNEEFIRCHSIRFIYLFCINVIAGAIGAYSTVVLLVYFPDKSMGLTYLCATSFCILILTIFCESANSVTANMIAKMRKILLKENLNKMNGKLSQVIYIFLETIETKNPKITLNGYLALNRSTLPMILGTTINFLVIMKQFSPM